MEETNIIKSVDTFHLIKEISKSDFGKVYLAKRKKNNNIFYAVKEINKQLVSDAKLLDYYNNEIKILTEIRHKNILPIIKTFGFPTFMYVASEFAENGDLSLYVNNYKSGKLPEKEAVNFLKQILAGLAILHQNGVIHRDIKPDNILVSKELVPLVADFGISKFGNGRGVIKKSGIPIYLAPEIQFKKESEENTFSSDIWAIGLVFYFMLFGEHYFLKTDLNVQSIEDLKKAQLEHSGENLKIDANIQDVSENSIKLLKQMIEYDTKKRATFKEIFQNTIFKDAKLTESLLVYVKELSNEDDFNRIEKQVANGDLNLDGLKLSSMPKLQLTTDNNLNKEDVSVEYYPFPKQNEDEDYCRRFYDYKVEAIDFLFDIANFFQVGFKNKDLEPFKKYFLIFGFICIKYMELLKTTILISITEKKDIYKLQKGISEFFETENKEKAIEKKIKSLEPKIKQIKASMNEISQEFISTNEINKYRKKDFVEFLSILPTIGDINSMNGIYLNDLLTDFYEKDLKRFYYNFKEKLSPENLEKNMKQLYELTLLLFYVKFIDNEEVFKFDENFTWKSKFCALTIEQLIDKIAKLAKQKQ